MASGERREHGLLEIAVSVLNARPAVADGGEDGIRGRTLHTVKVT